MTLSTPSEQSTATIYHTFDTPTGSALVTTSSTTELLYVPQESSCNQTSNSVAATTPVEVERTSCNSYITTCMYDHNMS